MDWIFGDTTYSSVDRPGSANGSVCPLNVGIPKRSALSFRASVLTINRIGGPDHFGSDARISKANTQNRDNREGVCHRGVCAVSAPDLLACAGFSRLAVGQPQIHQRRAFCLALEPDWRLGRCRHPAEVEA